MKRLLALVLGLCLLTACTPKQLYRDYQLRQSAEGLAKRADAMALVSVGTRLPSYEVGGQIYTDVEVTVIRGRKVAAGEKLTIRRFGGSIGIPGTDMVRMVTVDYAYSFPETGGEAFVLLRRAGEKYEIIDAMPTQAGQPVINRPEDQIYLPYLKSLK